VVSKSVPREKPFQFNGGGYATLKFHPDPWDEILGLIAGGVIRSEAPTLAKVKWFLIAGVVGLVSGAVMGWLGTCPVVKRIWTPSWTLYSGGWCFLLLAGFTQPSTPLASSYGPFRWLSSE